jgi:hypothetical protein
VWIKPHFICSFFDGHFDYFYFLTVQTTMDINIYVVLGIYVRVELLVYMVLICFSFSRTSKLFSVIGT